MYTQPTESILKRVARKRYKTFGKVENIDHLLYDQWLTRLFPKIFSFPFAPHHQDFWQFVSDIDDSKPPAYFLILPRGGGKDANAQGAIIYLGAKEIRKFCLYVCATQDLANKTVQTIAGMLEGVAIESHYPKLANRQLGKYGHSKGWRVDTLRCANGFNIVALGLDASVRGLRLDEFRPDLMVFSDVDSRKDTPDTIQKKIDTITLDILPAGTSNTVVIFAQNLIHEEGIINQVVTGQADFLNNRIVNGPVPAIENMAIEKVITNDDVSYKLTGNPTWAGQGLDSCEALINEIGPTNFRRECQHEIGLVEGGMYEDIDYQHCNPNEVPDLISIVCACDPAVTETGDKYAIQIDGIANNGKVYRLYSWEENSTALKAIVHAIAMSIKYEVDIIVFETDQGGDLWEESYNAAWEYLCSMTDIKQWLNSVQGDWQEAIDDKYPQGYELDDILEYGGIVNWDDLQLDFSSARAGSIGSKKHRGEMQHTEYEKGRFVHVRGTHDILEAALGRFPKRKPFDLHDAAFWAQYELLENAPAGN